MHPVHLETNPAPSIRSPAGLAEAKAAPMAHTCPEEGRSTGAAFGGVRYTQSKARSAEVLRLAIARMAEHDAGYNPMTFAVWYEHLAGINPALSEAVEQALRAAERIGDETIAHLYHEHVAGAEQQVAQRVTVDFDRVMQGIAVSAGSTDQRAGCYGEQLAQLERVLLGKDPGQLEPAVNAALVSTREMRGVVQSLSETARASQQEIDQLRADLVRYRIEAVTDPLTGLLNRKGFDQRLDLVLSNRPPLGAAHWLIMIDIDHFKRINDSHGHLVGDAVLQGLGGVLKQLTPTDNASCARYGGEEFAILLGAASQGDAGRVARSVCELVRAMQVRNRTTHEFVAGVTVSAGVAAWRPGDDASALIARADAALYRSKTMGRDRVTVS
jgi:diguanylate cyclase